MRNESIQPHRAVSQKYQKYNGAVTRISQSRDTNTDKQGVNVSMLEAIHEK